MSVNTVILSGRLTRDPDVRNLDNPDAATVARFTLAVDRPIRAGDSQNEKKADFPQITVFGKTAENVADYLMKGSLVNVQARIQTGSYRNKSGNEIYTTDIIAYKVDFLAGYRTKNSAESYNPLFDDPKKHPEGQVEQNKQPPSAPPDVAQNPVAAPTAQNNENRDYTNQESVAAPSSGDPGGITTENNGTHAKGFTDHGSQPAPFYDSISEFEEVSDDDEW